MSEQRGLLRILGIVFGVTMVIGNTIGSGILRTPGEVAARLPSPGWFLGVWIAGGLYSMGGAMAMAELAAMLPKSGGQYNYARRALGEYAGVVVGWTDWISSAAAIAAGAIALGELSGALWPAFASSTTIIAITIAIVFGVVHWIGVRSGDVTTQAWGVIKVGTLLAVAVACFTAAPIGTTATASTFPAGAALAGALVLALQNVLYTYDGWTGLIYFSGEVKDERKIARAMALGVLSVAVVYVALNAAFLHTLGIGGLSGEKFAARAAAVGIFGNIGDRIVSAVMAVSILGNVSAVMMSTCRVPYAMADDGLLPRVVSRVNARGTPDIALYGTVGVVLILIATGTFASVIALAALFYVAQYATSFASLFVLRVREPNLPRPYRAFGYPVIPAIVLIGAIAFVVGSFISDRDNSMRSLMVIIASYPVYRLTVYLRQRRTATATALTRR